MINNLQDLLTARNCGEKTFAELKKNIYKYTDCGAWIEESPTEISLGSIVEGCDYGTDTFILPFPFSKDQFDLALDMVESQAEEIWRDTHGCEHCFSDSYEEFDQRPIDPDCKHCEGDGAII